MQESFWRSVLNFWLARQSARIVGSQSEKAIDGPDLPLIASPARRSL